MKCADFGSLIILSVRDISGRTATQNNVITQLVQFRNKVIRSNRFADHVHRASRSSGGTTERARSERPSGRRGVSNGRPVRRSSSRRSDFRWGPRMRDNPSPLRHKMPACVCPWAGARASNMRSSMLVGSDVPAVKLRFLGTDLSDDDDERLLMPTRRAVKSLCVGSGIETYASLIIGRPKGELRRRRLLPLLLLMMIGMKLSMMMSAKGGMMTVRPLRWA
ncbi:hypothetical protein F5148DRAFT_118461 [Russula earlei]|uniref:Uncharacterized protein n=1 Tax=Russula earlei TaxID=71964 RepID=A0ACC0TRS4_9AGAM|nr:hypothetical protein F5148DRAFT_118461 [Russula earlei]